MESSSKNSNTAQSFLSIFIAIPLGAVLWFLLPQFFEINAMHHAYEVTISDENALYNYFIRNWPFFALVVVIWTWRSVVYVYRHWPRKQT